MRRHLGITRAQARQRPWWEYDLMVEGVLEEFYDEDSMEPESGQGDGSLASLGERGFNVRQVT